MRKVVASMVVALVTAVWIQVAVADKVPHKEYAAMKSDECRSCHKAEGIAPNHDADWGRGHRLLASKPVKNCAQCHDQAWCLDCHAGGGTDVAPGLANAGKNFVPRSHRSDFREIHPLKALDNPNSCVRCHESRFCTECHSRYKPTSLQFQSHRRQFQEIKLSAVGPKHEIFNAGQCQTCHPSGMIPSHHWSAEHAAEARRNLQSCQTCHNDGDVCMKCHSARTGLKVNPHPRGWNASSLKAKSSSRTCAKCHDNQ